jgi:hypothetical protein
MKEHPKPPPPFMQYFNTWRKSPVVYVLDSPAMLQERTSSSAKVINFLTLSSDISSHPGLNARRPIARSTFFSHKYIQLNGWMRTPFKI